MKKLLRTIAMTSIFVAGSAMDASGNVRGALAMEGSQFLVLPIGSGSNAGTHVTMSELAAALDGITLLADPSLRFQGLVLAPVAVKQS